MHNARTFRAPLVGISSTLHFIPFTSSGVAISSGLRMCITLRAGERQERQRKGYACCVHHANHHHRSCFIFSAYLFTCQLQQMLGFWLRYPVYQQPQTCTHTAPQSTASPSRRSWPGMRPTTEVEHHLRVEIEDQTARIPV